MERRETGRPTASRISVVIPNYNYAHHLPETVTSVLRQSVRADEIIIVDDGSTDDSREVARKLIAAHPDRSIELICQPNSGAPGATRNAGIERATGDYIVCLDADDLLSLDYLQVCAKALDDNPRAAMAYGPVKRFGAESAIGEPPEWDSRLELDANYMHCSAMFRRQAWVEAGGYASDPTLGYEDWDFWIGCIECGWEGVRTQAVFHYRRHTTGTYDRHVQEDVVTKARIVERHPSVYSPSQRRWAAGVLAGEAHALAAGARTGNIPNFYCAPGETPRDGRPLPVRKVCLIAREYPPSSGSDAARAAQMQAQLLRSAGVEVHVLTQARGGRLGTREDAGVFVHAVPVPAYDVPSGLSYVTSGIWSYLAAETFRKVDAALNFDLVHAPGDAAELLHLAPRTSMPLITSLHRIDISGDDPGQVLELTALKRADLLLSPSERVTDAIAKRIGQSLPPTEVIPVAFDPEMFPERPRGARRPGAVRALYFGRLDGAHRPELALHAVAAAQKSGLECELTVIGRDVDAYAERVLTPLQRQLGLDDIDFMPQIDDLFSLRRLVQGADVAILPFTAGGTPLAILESLSSGVPVITSDRVHFAGVIGSECGLAAVPVDDAVEFGRRAAELIADATWMSTGPRAAEWIRKAFDPENVIEPLLDCYSRVMAGPPVSVLSSRAGAERPGAPIEGARRVAVLALVEEIVAEPSLLQAWARTFDSTDDITLVILAPDWTPEVIERRLAPIVEQAGLDTEHAADLLALTAGASPQAHARLAAGATAILTRRRLAGPLGGLRRVDEGSLAGLRARVVLQPAA